MSKTKRELEQERDALLKKVRPLNTRLHQLEREIADVDSREWIRTNCVTLKCLMVKACHITDTLTTSESG